MVLGTPWHISTSSWFFGLAGLFLAGSRKNIQLNQPAFYLGFG
jgi:hypothetical protein